MSNDMRKLVNQAVKNALLVKDVVVKDLATEIAADHRHLLNDWKHDLALNAISAMVRDACKASEATKSQPLIPGVGDDLPRSISVPGKGSKPTRYVGIRRAKVGELRASIEMLTSQIDADTHRRDALASVLEECEELGANDHDLVSNVVDGAAAA